MKEIDKERFRLVAEFPHYQRMIDEAISAITQVIEKCQMPAVSFSFGKDSLVCVDIARKIKPDILIINVDRGDGGDVPEAIPTFFQYLETANFHRVNTPKTIFQIYEEGKGIENVNRKMLKNNLLLGIKKAKEMFGIDCQITGLRTEESKGRLYLNKYGNFHYSETNNVYLCKPVLHWSGDEIWAYIVSNDLPYLEWYDLEAKYVGYERARYSNWAGVFQIERGRIAYLRMTRPDLYEIYKQLYPEVKSYV